jgi:hypothetical protein
VVSTGEGILSCRYSNLLELLLVADLPPDSIAVDTNACMDSCGQQCMHGHQQPMLHDQSPADLIRSPSTETLLTTLLPACVCPLQRLWPSPALPLSW